MHIYEAIRIATTKGYHVHSFDGVATYYNGANNEWVVWTRTDNESSFMMTVEQTLLDPAFWQAFGRALEIDGVYPYGDWKHLWHAFIESLATGGTVEAFFAHIDRSSRETINV